MFTQPFLCDSVAKEPKTLVCSHFPSSHLGTGGTNCKSKLKFQIFLTPLLSLNQIISEFGFLIGRPFKTGLIKIYTKIFDEVGDF